MPRERNPCVYILASQPFGTIYIGVTSDLVARIYQHRTGVTGGFVSRYSVYHLVHFEQFDRMDAAIARENSSKTGTGNGR